jgi:hypothetical protein
MHRGMELYAGLLLNLRRSFSLGTSSSSLLFSSDKYGTCSESIRVTASVIHTCGSGFLFLLDRARDGGESK